MIQDGPGEEFLVKWIRMDQEKVQHRKTRVDCGRDQAPVSHGSSPALSKQTRIKTKYLKSKGRILLPNRMNFWKSAKGGRHFQSKNFLLQILGTLNSAF